MLDSYLDSYIIIGKESQTIHISLQKNEKININKKYLFSASSEELNENIYKNIDFLIIPEIKNTSDNNLKKADSPYIINLKNINSNIEYLSLSRGGKIMKIMPSLYNNLYVRLDSILAFNNGIELYMDKTLDNIINKIFKNNYFQNKINLISTNNGFKNNFESCTQFCLIKTKLNNKIEENNFNNLVNSFLFNKNNLISDIAFISGKNNLYEKRLGERESMILLNKSLIAFEGTVSFREISKKDNKYVNQLEDIIIDGPGLIIFEYCKRVNPIINNKKYLVIGLAIFIIFLQIGFNLLVFNKYN